MVVYAIIMLLTAGIFGITAILIYKGRTVLIHDYHQAKVTDHAGYGKAFGKAMGIIAVAMALSGLLALFGEPVMTIALAVLFCGLIAGITAIVRIQKKYNGGVF